MSRSQKQRGVVGESFSSSGAKSGAFCLSTLPPRDGCFLSIGLSPASLRVEVADKLDREMRLNAKDIAVLMKNILAQATHAHEAVFKKYQEFCGFDLNQSDLQELASEAAQEASADAILSCMMQLTNEMLGICSCNNKSFAASSDKLEHFACKYRIGYDHEMASNFHRYERDFAYDSNWKGVMSLGGSVSMWGKEGLTCLARALSDVTGDPEIGADAARVKDLIAALEWLSGYSYCGKSTLRETFNDLVKNRIGASGGLDFENKKLVDGGKKALVEVLVFEKQHGGLNVLGYNTFNYQVRGHGQRRLHNMDASRVGNDRDWNRLMKNELMYKELTSLSSSDGAHGAHGCASGKGETKAQAHWYYFLPTTTDKESRMICWGKMESEYVSRQLMQNYNESNRNVCDLIGDFCGGSDFANAQTLVGLFQQLVMSMR